ncbi:metal-dependent hydrolase [Marinobacter sp. AL4B]|uniref:metal-dependent hydrolase n=1 Tax=Marinobacter sp. AL4B TaxID=2871173 RepID=UPI0021CD8B88|nr:metal-dependent hydrolase [Marinobacter sp. AL4B]
MNMATNTVKAAKKKVYRSLTPKGFKPVVRSPDFKLSKDLPKYWWDNDPAKTLLLAALSASFPPGERFFIDSVRYYQDQIADPELQRSIRAFIGQEAHHSKEHKLMNGCLEEKGVGLARIEREIQWFMDWMRKNLSPERQLAHTVAVEHFTAMMAEEFLLKFDALEEMDPRIAPVWAWHAIEESEHKSVAFDVYRTVGGSEFVRITEMMYVSVMFPFYTSLHLMQLMKEEGELGNLKSWAGALNYMWGKPGIFRNMIPSYLRYYSPRFHPWNNDVRDLLEEAKKRWLPASLRD